MILTEKQLRESTPRITDENVVKYLQPLQLHLQKYQIDSPLRIAHFLAQVGHESGSFLYYRELASGTAYEGRKDLGNTEKGDGVKFKGRGCIQITGRNNYALVSKFIFNDLRLLDHPELLELPPNGVLASCWYWDTRKLNLLADRDDLVSITKKINGGLNGLQDRKLRLELAKKAVGI